MYKYASKFSPNQMNLISSRLRYGNHVLTKDKNSSWPFRQVNHVRANIPLNLVSVENYTPIWPATYFTNKRYFSATRTSKPNILAKYYRLTAGRSSLAKISKNSLQQSRGYASLLKKITGFFSAKPATPVKPTREFASTEQGIR
ncbi:hypothetical protein QE152_g1649 [Popillia japonica]|uniref:Uncharacterized protein n=1 Tax=Popillia japonica TaxID=7064 RepID=A0AAW1N7F3_POPJA